MQSKLKSSSTDLTQSDAQMNSNLYAFYIFKNYKTLLCSVAQIKLTFYGWCLQLCMHSCWMWRLNRKNSLVQLSGSTPSACMHVCILTLNMLKLRQWENTLQWLDWDYIFLFLHMLKLHIFLFLHKSIVFACFMPYLLKFFMNFENANCNRIIDSGSFEQVVCLRLHNNFSPSTIHL